MSVACVGGDLKAECGTVPATTRAVTARCCLSPRKLLPTLDRQLLSLDQQEARSIARVSDRPEATAARPAYTFRMSSLRALVAGCHAGHAPIRSRSARSRTSCRSFSELEICRTRIQDKKPRSTATQRTQRIKLTPPFASYGLSERDRGGSPPNQRQYEDEYRWLAPSGSPRDFLFWTDQRPALSLPRIFRTTVNVNAPSHTTSSIPRFKPMSKACSCGRVLSAS